MRYISIMSGALALALAGTAAQAQVGREAPHVQPVASQVVHLSASASAAVPQDWLSMTLSVQKEGTDPMAVQAHLKTALATALAQSQAMAQTGALEVSTGPWSVSPRYGRDGKTNGWVGVAELVLQGRDIDRITAVAGRVQGMAVSQVQWAVSPELKRQTENRILGEAVAQFQSRAVALTRSFGLAAYDLKEVRVTTQESVGEPHARMAAVQMDAPQAYAPVPAQGGSSRVVVQVAGSIQLR
jgi:predicted secreted protein